MDVCRAFLKLHTETNRWLQLRDYGEGLSTFLLECLLEDLKEMWFVVFPALHMLRRGE